MNVLNKQPLNANVREFVWWQTTPHREKVLTNFRIYKRRESVYYLRQY
jgi:hypothetical protein